MLMQSYDTWEERYLSIIPEKLTAPDARVLLVLIREDPERFMAALEEFIDNNEDLEPDAE
jgi:hypothetical protein